MKTDEETTKIYYSIGEVSEMLELSGSLIRFWEKEFSILTPKKRRNGNRMFTQIDIDNLKLIRHLLKDRGYTIIGANQKIKENRQEALNHSLLVDKLRFVKSELEKIKNQL